jgi:hypothetical protein
VAQDLLDISDAHKKNWTNIIAFGVFHLGAIAALFMFSWRPTGCRSLPLLDVYWPWHQHGLPPIAHAYNAPMAVPYAVMHNRASRVLRFCGKFMI